MIPPFDRQSRSLSSPSVSHRGIDDPVGAVPTCEDAVVNTNHVRITILLVSLLAGACRPSDATLTGEVFIVTRGGENYKLGLVEVRAYPDSVLRNAMASGIAAAKSQLPALNRVGDSLSKRAQQLSAVRDQAAKSSSANILSDALQQRSYTAYARYTEAYAELERNRLERDVVAEAPFYISRLPAPSVIAKTDADGKFSMKVPLGRVALVAHASRSVGDSNEDYYWLVWNDVTGKEAATVMLSNDNLFGNRCASCYAGIELPKL